MKLTTLYKSKKMKIGISLALILALLLSSLCFGASLETAEVANPAQGGDPLQITMLKIGKNVSEETIKGEECNESAGASKPDDNIVEQSDHKKQERTDIPKDKEEKQEQESQRPEPDDFSLTGTYAEDKLLEFQAEDGGFRHTLDGESDLMATEQAFYALVAAYRIDQGMTSLFAMRPVV